MSQILAARSVTHSDRSASIGSTFVALRAGTRLASNATTVSSRAMTVKVAGSVALTPKSSPAISRVRPSASEAEPGAEQGEHQALAHHETQDFPPLGAEREADAELVRPRLTM